MDDNILDKGPEDMDGMLKGADSSLAEGVEKAEGAVSEIAEKIDSSFNDAVKSDEPAATAEKEENAAGSSPDDHENDGKKDPFKRIDFGKPLYQAAPAPEREAPKALGPSPSAGSTGTAQSGPLQPVGAAQQSGPSQPAGAAPMNGASQPMGTAPMGGASQPMGTAPMGGPMQPGGMAPMGGPSPFGGAGPQFGGMMPNGDPMFSPYGGQVPQYGGAVPQPVEPVQSGGAYAQGGPGFGPGMGYQQIPPYQQPMGDMYYGYQDPYMSMMQANNQGMGLGIASMVLGILALVTCCCWYISGPLSAISLILGIIGIKSDNGKGMAIAGVVCSGVALLILGCIMVYSCSVYGSAFNSFRNLMNIP